jgi:ABC-2 type transport system permease protein
MKYATRYIWIAYTAARSSVAYAGEALARVIFMAVILYIFMRLWAVVYSGVGSEQLGGLTMPQMLWYLVITEAIMLSAPRVWAEVDQEVRTGQLAVRLIHPVSYVFSHMGKAAGERFVKFAMNLTIGSAIALVLVGPIPVSAGGFAMFLVVLPMAFLLEFLGSFLVGLGAFWLESTAGLALIYARSVMLLGGMILPISMYPDSVQPVLRALPFASMMSTPGRMFVSPDAAVFGAALATQAVAVAVLACLVAGVQATALKRLFTNGG